MKLEAKGEGGGGMGAETGVGGAAGSGESTSGKENAERQGELVLTAQGDVLIRTLPNLQNGRPVSSRHRIGVVSRPS